MLKSIFEPKSNWQPQGVKMNKQAKKLSPDHDTADVIELCAIHAIALSENDLESISAGVDNPGVTEEFFGNYNFILPYIEQDNLYKSRRRS